MKLIVGLGNPGPKYAHTRHNIGFEVVAEIAKRFETGRAKSRFHGETVDFLAANEKVVLLSPLTYMNESGRSVRAAVDFFQLNEKSELLVVCDDFNLDFAKLRFRGKGSSGGQRGLEDIIRHLGEHFCRLRVGIGAPPAGWKVTDYVLSRFRDEEAEELRNCVKRAADAALFWAARGVQEAMNRFNSGDSGDDRTTAERKPAQETPSTVERKEN